MASSPVYSDFHYNQQQYLEKKTLLSEDLIGMLCNVVVQNPSLWKFIASFSPQFSTTFCMLSTAE